MIFFVNSQCRPGGKGAQADWALEGFFLGVSLEMLFEVAERATGAAAEFANVDLVATVDIFFDDFSTCQS